MAVFTIPQFFDVNIELEHLTLREKGQLRGPLKGHRIEERIRGLRQKGIYIDIDIDVVFVIRGDVCERRSARLINHGYAIPRTLLQIGVGRGHFTRS